MDSEDDYFVYEEDEEEEDTDDDGFMCDGPSDDKLELYDPDKDEPYPYKCFSADQVVQLMGALIAEVNDIIKVVILEQRFNFTCMIQQNNKPISHYW